MPANNNDIVQLVPADQELRMNCLSLAVDLAGTALTKEAAFPEPEHILRAATMWAEFVIGKPEVPATKFKPAVVTGVDWRGNPIQEEPE